MAAPAVPGVAAPDLSIIHRLTNLNDINRLLHETLAKERSIDNELDRLLAKRTDLERSFILLNTPSVETLELVRADCEQLLGSVSGTADLADHISSKVRKLDLVQTRVQAVLSNINLTLDRANCISGVQAAMDNEDYEAAANYISTFMSLEASLSGSAHAVDASQAEDQKQVLMDARSKLEVVVDKRFDEAVAKRDLQTAVRFARLYKPIGKPVEGLKRFIEFLKLNVNSAARAQYGALDEQLQALRKVDWAGAFAGLFKEVATVLEAHQGFVQETFGPEAVLELVQGLQAECDTAGGRLVQRFLETRQVERVVREIQQRKRTPGISNASTDPLLDHRSVEGHVEELLRLCQLAEEYNTFMLSKMRDAIAPQPLTALRESSFRSGGFGVAVRQLLGNYLALEEYYLEETCTMAIRIDEVVVDAQTSSMVEDVFFIARKVGLRSLATMHVQSICAILAEVNNSLANAFRSALQARLQSGPAKLMAETSGSAGSAASVSSTEYAVALNNCDVAADYVNKVDLLELLFADVTSAVMHQTKELGYQVVKNELEGYLQDMFPGVHDRERSRSVLQDLSKTGNDFRQMCSRSLEQLAEAVIPRLRSVLDEVAQVSYLLNEADYSASDSEDGWAGRLVALLRVQVGWMQPLLTTHNYESLFHLVLDKVVARLEVLLARKAFNQLGGLQLDRDVRLLVSSLSDMTTRTVRDKFSRLSQMALILGLENLDEFMEYWGDDSGSITWRLSPAEVRAVLSQRNDFSKDAIMALML